MNRPRIKVGNRPGRREKENEAFQSRDRVGREGASRRVERRESRSLTNSFKRMAHIEWLQLIYPEGVLSNPFGVDAFSLSSSNPPFGWLKNTVSKCPLRHSTLIASS